MKLASMSTVQTIVRGHFNFDVYWNKLFMLSFAAERMLIFTLTFMHERYEIKLHESAFLLFKKV